MKIAAIDSFVLRVPTQKPIALEFPEQKLIVTHIRTDDGVTGLGYSLAMGGGGAESIQVYLETRLKPLLLGQDPLFVERLWDRMYRSDRGIKRQGIAAYAISALDIGLWDIVGKTANLPLFKLCRRRGPALQSGRMPLLQDEDPRSGPAREPAARGDRTEGARRRRPDDGRRQPEARCAR